MRSTPKYYSFIFFDFMVEFARIFLDWIFLFTNITYHYLLILFNNIYIFFSACEGTKGLWLDSKNIENFRDCTVIEGNLALLGVTFTGYVTFESLNCEPAFNIQFFQNQGRDVFHNHNEQVYSQWGFIIFNVFLDSKSLQIPCIFRSSKNIAFQ